MDGAGVDSVETRKIEVQRTFADFEDFWATAMLGSTIGPTVATMVASDRDQLKTRVRARLPADDAGRITYGAWGKCGKRSRTRIGTTEGGSRRISTCIAHAFGLFQFSQAPFLLSDEAQYCFGAGSTSGGTRRKPPSVPLANAE